jgi:hypothetical protein
MHKCRRKFHVCLYAEQADRFLVVLHTLHTSVTSHDKHFSSAMAWAGSRSGIAV